VPTVTKQRMSEAFFRLSKKKCIDKITVKDISDACGMSRQTFYYHFQDVLDLIEWSSEQALQQTIERSLAQEDPVDAIEQFVILGVENRSMMKKLLSSQHRDRFQNLLTEGVKTYLAELIRTRNPDLSTAYEELERALLFYAGGITALMLDAGGSALDTHKFAESIYRLLMGDYIAKKEK